MKWVLLIIGALLALFGTVWTLQGLNVLGGSAMSGATIWAIIGPITALIGVSLITTGIRRR